MLEVFGLAALILFGKLVCALFDFIYFLARSYVKIKRKIDGFRKEMQDIWDEIGNKLQCKLGFHDNHAIGEDLRFMPHVKVLLGSCRREACGKPHNYFFFLKTRKIITTNSGIHRIFGKYCIMPLMEDQM